MAEKKVSVRLTAEGGERVQAVLEGLGLKGKKAFDDIQRGQKSAEASANVFTTAIDREERAFTELRAQLDPTFAATRRYEQAVEAANRAVASGVATQDEATAVIARAKAQYIDAGTEATRFAGQMQVAGAGSSRLGGQVQIASYQVGDFFVQVAAGTAASRALAMQLPQLLGGFGVVGAAAGAVAAILGALIPALFKTAEAAKPIEAMDWSGAQSAMKSLADLEDSYKAAIEARALVQSNVSDGAIRLMGNELRAKRALFEVDLATLELRKEQLQTQVEESRAAFNAAVDEINATAMLGLRPTTEDEANAGITRDVGQSEALKDLRQQQLELKKQNAELSLVEITIERINGAFANGAAALKGMSGSAEGTRTEVEKMADAIARSYEGYQNLRSESEASLQAARDMAAEMQAQADMAALVAQYGEDSVQVALDRVSAEREAQQALVDAMDVTQQMKDELMAAWDAAKGISTASGDITFNSAVASAAALTDELLNALGVINAIRRAQQTTNLNADTNGGQSAPSGIPGGGWVAPDPGATNIIRPPRRRGGGGGRGGQDPLLAEAKRIFEETRTEAEKYAAELADLNELHKLGYLDAETFGRAIANLDEEFGKDGLKEWKKTLDGIADSLASAIVNGENLGDVFANVVKKMAQDLISSGLKTLLNELFMPKPGGGGGFLGAILGALIPKRAEGGRVSGGRPYLVGERGPELYVPGASGTIVPNNRLGGGGGGGVVRIVIEEAPGFAARVRAEAEGVAVQITQAGLQSYDRGMPGRVKSIQSDPRRRS
jgi:hypothetical protein